MGATEFYHKVENEPSIDVAFRRARREATEAYGNRGYTGSISEKDKYRQISAVDTYEEADDLAYKMISDADPRIDDKWGPAGAIKYTNEHNQICWLFFGIASC
jgi:hypothetical protein